MRISRENWRRVVLFLQLLAFVVLSHTLLGLGQSTVPTGKNHLMAVLAWISIGLAILIKVFPASQTTPDV